MVASWPPAAIGATRRVDRGPANDRNRRKPATSLATYECGIKRNAVSVEEIEGHAGRQSELSIFRKNDTINCVCEGSSYTTYCWVQPKFALLRQSTRNHGFTFENVRTV